MTAYPGTRRGTHPAAHRSRVAVPGRCGGGPAARSENFGVSLVRNHRNLGIVAAACDTDRGGVHGPLAERGVPHTVLAGPPHPPAKEPLHSAVPAGTQVRHR